MLEARSTRYQLITMAKIINAHSKQMPGATRGERRFARRIESHLEEDYLCWYDVPIGNLRRYPDFVILHPNRGILLLEVKDWKLEDLYKIDKLQVKHHFGGATRKSANPLEQARQCMLQLVNRLNIDPQLTEQSGRFQGKLVTPYGHGAVFPNITRKQLDENIALEDQEHILPPHLIITKDEMVESIDSLAFQEKLWGMFNYNFNRALTLPQINRLRWHIFPEIRVGAKQIELFIDTKSTDHLPPNPEVKVPDIIRVMDIQQEQLARSLGQGHRVIHGVAGSGKTLILGFRCEQLAESLTKPILVLCYNVSLAASLKRHIISKGLEEKVEIYHFHEWCKSQLTTYHFEPSKSDKPTFEQHVDGVIEGVDKAFIPRAQYGAVMIDEGHDFESEWLRLITQMVDPATDSLLLLYDDAQSIYKKKGGLDFSLSSVGIKAQGRTTILKINYRNTMEVLQCAFAFAEGIMTSQAKQNDDSIPLISPESAGTSGPHPMLKQRSSIEDECKYAASCIKHWLEAGELARDIAVIYLNKQHAGKLTSELKKQQIKHLWLKNKAAKASYASDNAKITILTAHSSKGLEFKKVILIGLGHINDDKENNQDHTKLIYVGMTRAKRDLLMLYSSTNAFTRKLTEITTISA